MDAVAETGDRYMLKLCRDFLFHQVIAYKGAGPRVELMEFLMDPTWAETGDRYMFKLYRDFLFCQVGAAYKGDWLTSKN